MNLIIRRAILLIAKTLFNSIFAIETNNSIIKTMTWTMNLPRQKPTIQARRTIIIFFFKCNDWLLEPRCDIFVYQIYKYISVNTTVSP